jgi:hypothetical protein
MQSLAKKFCAISILLFSSFTFAQIIDSSNVIRILNPDSLSTNSDSLLTKDSTLTSAKHDSLVILFSSSLSENSYFINKNEIKTSEYRYAGDYLRIFPFNFIKDLGFPGQPNETFLYGVGNSAVNYLLDGVSVNERYGNSFNLNLIETEDVDSIEIVPLPKGFLYGAFNNLVSVNFITKDFVTRQPYSRIRYYQGPDRETLLDGYFNMNITRKLIGSFEITNRIVDSTYKNTEFSIWQGKFKLKYLWSNELNIIASYNYNDYNAGYSGGVDVDSIIRAGDNVNDILYNPNLAPVVYPNGKVKTLMHLPRLRFLIKPAEWLKTDASIFYLYSENSNNGFANENLEDKVIGVNVRNTASYKNFNFQLNADFEKDNIFREYNITPAFQDNFRSIRINYNLFSVAGIISTDIDNGKLKPSVFYKVSQINGDTNFLKYGSGSNISTGLGADVTFKPTDNLSFYFGYSLFKQYFDTDNISLLEIGSKFTSDFLNADIKYFVNDYQYIFTNGLDGPDNLSRYIPYGKVNGLGANISINFWKLLLESSSAYYYSAKDNLIGIPNFQTQTGLYYKNLLFDDNLDLKTGLVLTYTGKNNVYTNENGMLAVPSSYKIDFTLAGEIHKAAMVYFLWQNLLGNTYYITPYYPMPSRSIRFGVAWELFN